MGTGDQGGGGKDRGVVEERGGVDLSVDNSGGLDHRLDHRGVGHSGSRGEEGGSQGCGVEDGGRGGQSVEGSHSGGGGHSSNWYDSCDSLYDSLETAYLGPQRGQQLGPGRGRRR